MEESNLDEVSATYDPLTGDTIVIVNGMRRSFSQVYPVDQQYAAAAAWWAERRPISLWNRRYDPFGTTRFISRDLLEPLGTFRGVPVFGEAGARQRPDVIYLAVRPGCEFQPYARG